MSDVILSLTQRQYMLLIDLMESLPRALNNVGDEVSPQSVSVPSTPASNSEPDTPVSEHPPMDPVVNLEPELAVVKGAEGMWTKLDFVFSVGTVALEVYDAEALEESDLPKHSIARFALVKTHVGFKQLSDGAMEAEFSLKTLAFSSTRSAKSVFKDIIPSATHDGNQA